MEARCGSQITVTCLRGLDSGKDENGLMKSAAVLLLLFTLHTAAAQTPPQLDTLRAEGYEALYNLDYEAARKRFQKMIEIAPEHPVERGLEF